jgi:hypothetical protein
LRSLVAPEKLIAFSSVTSRRLHPQSFDPTNFVFIADTVAEMVPKPRQEKGEENHFLLPPVDLDKIPLVNTDRLIVDTKCDFDFSDLQSWLREVFLDQSDEIGLWESNLPLYLFPQIHHFLEFTLKFQAHYIPEHRAFISSFGDNLFLITPEDIDQMMQIPRADSTSPFNLEILTELYQKMTFPQRAQIFDLFLSSLCALLGYYSDQWVDQPILGFLSIFSTDENPTTQFDFNTFLANNIHEQFVNFGTEGMFRYSSILAYMFFYFQEDKFSFSMQKMDTDGRPQVVTTWTSLLKHNSTEYSFKEFIDLFYHPVVSMLRGRPKPRINDEV